jgi:hypothetical protein
MQGRVQELSSGFRVKSLDEPCGVLEVGKQHGDLLALAFESTAGSYNFLREIRWGIVEGCGGGRCSVWGRGGGRVSDPDQHFAILIGRKPLALDQFDGQVF